MSVDQLFTKTALMSLISDGVAKEAFTFCPEDGSPPVVYDVTAIREWCRRADVDKAPIYNIGLDQITPFVRQHRDTEQTRVDALPYDSWRFDPGIFILMKDGSHLMIDGHHRALRREKEGCTDMRFYMVEEQYAIHPNENWRHTKEFGIDWGEKDIVDGKLVPRG